MKKLILSAAALTLCAAGASAQHAGQFGIGVNVGVQPVIEGKGSPTNFLLGGRLQYSATDLIRVAVDLNGGFEDKFISTFTATANADFMVPVTSGLYVYPTVGLGYGNLHYNFDFLNASANESRFVFNIGIGAEYEFSKNIAAGLEFKYQYMKNYGSLPVFVNVSYKF